jgi:hypothetical protein
MSEIHKFKCDGCKVTVKAEYNGAHYLFPKNWACVRNVDVRLIGHLCDACLIRVKLNPFKITITEE